MSRPPILGEELLDRPGRVRALIAKRLKIGGQPFEFRFDRCPLPVLALHLNAAQCFLGHPIGRHQVENSLVQRTVCLIIGPIGRWEVI